LLRNTPYTDSFKDYARRRLSLELIGSVENIRVIKSLSKSNKYPTNAKYRNTLISRFPMDDTNVSKLDTIKIDNDSTDE
jgi:hypothetical protein